MSTTGHMTDGKARLASELAHVGSPARPGRRPGLAFYRNAFYWFVLVLVVLVVGFWKTYFSQLGSGSLDAAHHGHGIVMLLWVLLLIGQSWLIRNRRNALHRMFGRMSLVLAPAVIASGVWVNVHMLRGAEPPLPSSWLSAYWFGFFLVFAFAILYTMAYVHRRKMQLHATALVFITPGSGVHGTTTWRRSPDLNRVPC